MEQIDEALAAGNKPLFFKLSAQYNDLLKNTARKRSERSWKVNRR